MPSISGPVVFAHPESPPIPHEPTIKTSDDEEKPPAAVESGGTSATGVGTTSPPQAIAATHTIPPYPPLSLRMGHEGTVRLRIVLDEGGNVVAAQILSSSGYAELDGAAISWVERQWRYKPAVDDGRAVRATAGIAIAFRLARSRD